MDIMKNPEDKITKDIYCAIYTRKSTNEGLERDFTTLDVQREAGESYIQSQKMQGWKILPEKYDDGGFTGADTNRPAIQRLINDIKLSKINCVVVYKVDRLSRSLLDFTRLLEFFDEHKVSFVSVTQHFNTDTSMGRLTLHILLSFAQFEREMISERTKDKMGAARKRGKWIGGQPPLGYDIDRANHKLVINEKEARLVNKIYKIYLDTGSLLNTTIVLNEKGFKTKQHVSKKGRSFGGKEFNKNIVHRVLTSPIYMGKILYSGNLYEGEHKAIIQPALFEKVQERIKSNSGNRQIRKNAKCIGLLSQILRCKTCDSRMIHTYTSKNKAKKYRYYVCLKAQKQGYDTCLTRSINAQKIEDNVIRCLPKIEIKDNTILRDRYRKVIKELFSVWDTLTLSDKLQILKKLFISIDYSAQSGAIGFNLNDNGINELYFQFNKEKM